MNKKTMEAIFLIIVFAVLWLLSMHLSQKDNQIKALQEEVKQLKESK